MNINITILGQAVSFVIFVLFCMKYIWPPIISVIEKRQKEISDMFAAAEKSKKVSKEQRMEAVHYLEQAKIEAKLIVTRANQYKDQIIEQAKCEAQAEREKILLQTYEEIDIKKKCVAEELQKKISLLIIFGIEKILGCSINQYIHQNVINSVLNELSRCDIDDVNH